MSGSQITVIEPNGIKRTKPLAGRGLSIGRGEDNDLMLAYAAISRNHAQITFDAGRYYVTDLNSANGTYLSNKKLEPSVPTVWTPGQPLRIGDVLIHLERTASPGHKVEVNARTETGPIPRTKSDTFVGPLPRGGQAQPAKGKGRSLVWIFIVLVVLLLLAALGAAAIYYFLL